MAAMAGQFLTGDKTGTSNAIGTIMVTGVAMLGSLTVLPATLALLGRHVDKGRIRIPFLRRRKPVQRDSRIWSFILDRVLRRPGLSAFAAIALLLVIASPALHMKVHQTGINDLPPDMPGYTVLKHMNTAFPSNSADATVVVTAPDVNSPEMKRGDRRPRADGEADRPDGPAVRGHHQPGQHGRVDLDDARRHRHRPGVQGRAGHPPGHGRSRQPSARSAAPRRTSPATRPSTVTRRRTWPARPR